MQEICVMLKLSVKVGNPGNREDGLTGQIIADISKYFCLFVWSDFTSLISILNNKPMRYYYQPHFTDKKAKDQKGRSPLPKTTQSGGDEAGLQT